MKNILATVVFCTVFLLFSAVEVSAAAPAPTSSSAPVLVVDSVSLFWPLSPGKTMESRFFWLKTLKENIRGFFTFGKAQKGAYESFLGTKRVIEAELLLKKGNKLVSDKELDSASSDFDNASANIKQAKADNSLTGDIKQEVSVRVDNLKLLLRFLAGKYPDSKSKIESTLDKVDNLGKQL